MGRLAKSVERLLGESQSLHGVADPVLVVNRQLFAGEDAKGPPVALRSSLASREFAPDWDGELVPSLALMLAGHLPERPRLNHRGQAGSQSLLAGGQGFLGLTGSAENPA